MALENVAPVLAKDFVDVKIDTDRMVGGNDILKRYLKKPGGIPWFVFTNGEGEPIVTSDDPDHGNVGFPAQDFEIAHFRRMVEKVATRITPAEIEMLARSLVGFRDVKLPAR